MHDNSRKESLRRGRAVGKIVAVALSLLGCWTLPACGVGRTVRLADLERAPRITPVAGQRVIVADPTALHELCTALGPRLGLLQVRRAADWDRLVRAAPELGPCPDLRAGIVVGLVCRAGTTLDGRWPVRIEGVRLYGGAGLLEARFRGGTFLPDGTMLLETAYVPGLTAVLAADVNGTTFCP
jgi:hypothetical protein